jgi:hypothetical protein
VGRTLLSAAVEVDVAFSALSFVKGSQARDEQSLGSIRRDASTAEQAEKFSVKAADKSVRPIQTLC